MTEDDIFPKLDPREVLAYLNEMGIRNISGEKLKEFMCDLKKLIRYDIQCKIEQGEMKLREPEPKSVLKGPERLHSCSTFSSRSKSVKLSEPRKPLACLKNINPIPVIKVHSDTTKDHPANIQQRISRRCHSATTDVPNSVKSRDSKSSTTVRSSNFIKVPRVEKPKKSDPVSLFHSYSSLWAKYKANLPGENSWSGLRWSVREKLLGAKPHYSIKVPTHTQECLAKRREGWVE